MRILTVVHTRWSRDLGGPRAQIELSAEWKKLNHYCEKFSLEDAFPSGQQPPRGRFADAAAEFVKANANRFDIIDCHQTDLPFSKAELQFSGLLVARSVGLMPLYAEILARQNRKDLWSSWGPRILAGWVRRLPTLTKRTKEVAERLRDVETSFFHADLINVANRDDKAFIVERYGIKDKCVQIPFGLSDAAHAAFGASTQPALTRKAANLVIFVGNWEPRKGSRDWGKIVCRLRRLVPDVNFRFVGTSADRGHVLRSLGTGDVRWVEVIPEYANADLPKLVGRGTVAAFPSYVEGFGFAVLETLAAGLPTIAYDAPGPREMLGRDRLVPAGDATAMADRLAILLTNSLAEYELASAEAAKSVAHLRWQTIARETLNVYEAQLSKIRTKR